MQPKEKIEHWTRWAIVSSAALVLAIYSLIIASGLATDFDSWIQSHIRQCVANSNLCKWITAWFILLLSATVVIYQFGTLAQRHGSDVRLVIWLFTLFALITFLFLAWAANYKHFENGHFVGSWAKELNWFYDFLFDLKTDLLIPTVLFSIYAVPNLVTYGIAGIFGCATSTRFGPASRILFWSYVKSIVTISGAYFGNNLFFTLNATFAEKEKRPEAWLAMSSMAFFMLYVAILSLVIYRRLPFKERLSNSELFVRFQRTCSRHSGTQI
jgi:hypothetical protein